MRFAVIIAVAFLPLATSAIAAQPDEGWSVYGPGNESCGAWNRNRSDVARRNTDLGWLAGFLSGHNLVTSATGLGNLTDGLDFSAFQDWMDKRCAANPLERVGNAARTLAKTLIGRPKD